MEERAHSLDSLPFYDDDDEANFNLPRRVHFDDEQQKSVFEKKVKSRNKFTYPPQTVHEITTKLKASYERITSALEVLRKLLTDLSEAKDALECREHTSRNIENISEIKRLLSEVKHLQCCFQNVGERKNIYLEELSGIQMSLQEDRENMERWGHMSRDSNRKLKTKIDKSSRITREQQQLINKLKKDNISLWKTLQEIQVHLHDENIDTMLPDPFVTRKILPRTPSKSDSIEFTCDVYPVSDQTSVKGSQDGVYSDSNSITSSSQEKYLSEKLNLLLEKSENIQRLISNVGRNECAHRFANNGASKQCFHFNEQRSETREIRIPSENENVVRCDMNDIVRRCEDLERKVDECSTKDIRERLMSQLHEIDKQSAAITCSERQKCFQGGHWNSCSREEWKPEKHRRVREELIKCLDKIVLLERKFTEAQDEITTLRKYIKETAEEKEFCEKTFKREAMELRLIVCDKSRDIEVLKENLKDALHELKSKEQIMERVEELECLLEERDRQIAYMNGQDHKNIQYLRTMLEAKNVELENLKREMRNAIKSFESLKVNEGHHHQEMKESNENLQTEVKSLKQENKKLRTSIEDNLNDELTLLQEAIQDAERRMKTLQEENIRMKQNLTVKEEFNEELELEHQSLIARLQVSENETLYLKSQMANLEKSFYLSSYVNNDTRVKELERQLEAALEKKGLALKETFEHYFQSIDPVKVNDQEDLVNSLIRDNNKYVEVIEHKDKTIDGLREDLDNLLKTVDKVKVNDQEDLVNSLIRDNNKYVEVIEHKDKTIDGLREDLNDLAKAVEFRVIETPEPVDEAKYVEVNCSGPENSSKNMITEELFHIRKNLADSHHELIDKIVALHEELINLKNENNILQQHVSKSQSPLLIDKKLELRNQNEQLKDENVLLRDSLNTPYPGLVDSILAHGKEVKRLHDENELLRLALSNDRKELVDSNLRKKARIKELESELVNVKPSCSPTSSLKYRRRSSSQGETPEMLKNRLALNEKVDDKSKHKKYVDTEKRHGMAIGNDDNLKELNRLNETVKKLQKEKIRQKEKYLKETDKLKGERDQLKTIGESNAALKEELCSLRNAFKHLNENADLAKNEQIKESETQVKSLKKSLLSSKKGMGPTLLSSPEKDTLGLDLFEKDIMDLGSFERSDNKQKFNEMLSENEKLKHSLEKANSDVGRMAKIIERERQNVSLWQADKSKINKLEEKVIHLKEESGHIKKRNRTLQNETDNLKSELQFVQNELSNAELGKQKAITEANKLKHVIKRLDEKKQQESGNFHENNQEREGLNVMVKVLTESVDELQLQRDNLEQNLKFTETKNLSIENKINSLENEKLTLEQDLLNANIELNNMREERKELEGKNQYLSEELDNITNEITEKRVAEWFEEDEDRRLALLSPNISNENDVLDTERRSKRDQSRIVRKLQVENQTLRGKLNSLADESVDTTKLIADLERGHGHLTGTLRCHLILQKASTGKLLEGCLQQYTSDYDALQRKFSALEMKYDKEKKFTKRRDYAWELFTNASATINNIHTILNEGLVKVEEDLEKDWSDEDFENKDYKSRLWILRRRLSDVENRHRELQLRSEELSIRLDAKTTEFEVTQDELEDTTRDLESRDTSIHTLRSELKNLNKENAKLNELIKILEEKTDNAVAGNDTKSINEDDFENVKNTLAETIKKLNEKDAALNIMKKMQETSDKDIIGLKNKTVYLEKRLKEITEQRDKLKKEAENRAGYMSNVHDDHGTIHMLRDDIRKLAKEKSELKEDIVLKQRQMYSMSKDLYKLRTKDDKIKTTGKREESGIKMIQEIAELKAQKFLLETKLNKEAERRKGKSLGNDDKYLEKSFQNKLTEKEEEIERMKRELTFVKDSKNLSTHNNRNNVNGVTTPQDGSSIQQTNSAIQQQDGSMTQQIGDVGQQKDGSSTQQGSRTTKQSSTTTEQGSGMTQQGGGLTSFQYGSFTQQQDGSMNYKDLVKYNEHLKSEIQLLRKVMNKKQLGEVAFEKTIRRQTAELESLTRDVNTKRKKIKELLIVIEILKENSSNYSAQQIGTIIENTRAEEITSLNNKLQEKEMELNLLKMKIDENENEIERLKTLNSAMSTDEDKFQELYLNQINIAGNLISPSLGNDIIDNYLNEMPPQSGLTESNTHGMQSGATSDSGFPSNMQADTLSNTQSKTNSEGNENTYLIDLSEPYYEDLLPYSAKEEVVEEVKGGSTSFDVMESSQIPRLIKKKPFESKMTSGASKIPVLPTTKNRPAILVPTSVVKDEQPHYANLITTEQELNRTLQDQHEDIQTLLQSVEHFENENEKLKEELKNTKLNEKEEQVNMKIILAELQNELDVYKSNIGVTEHETLQKLGYERLNDVIDCYINKRNWTEIGRLQKENENNKTKRNNNNEIFALTEKCNLKDDENKTLKDLLETQTQNVQSQEAVIKTLKHDFSHSKSKFKKDSDTILQELKEKKIEAKNLKKQIKENGKLLHKAKSEHKHDVQLLKSKLKNENINDDKKEESIRKLKKENEEKEEEIQVLDSLNQDVKEKIKILELHNFQQKINEKEKENLQKEEYEKQIVELNEKLKTTERDYDDVLKRAESALEDAKRKLNEQKKENDKTKKQLHITEEKQNNEMELFKTTTEEMNEALSMKNDLLNSLRNEFQGYKETTNKDIEILTKEITELEKQCRDYKILLEKSDSTTSELQSTKSELESIKNELNQKSRDDEKSNQNYFYLGIERDSTNSALADNERSRDHKQPRDYEQTRDHEQLSDSHLRKHEDLMDGTNNMELEVECEILKGCNEELEQEVESLKEKIIRLEANLESEGLELIQTRKDLEKSLEYLREMAEKNDDLVERNLGFENELKNEKIHNEELQKKLVVMKLDDKRVEEEKIRELERQLFKSMNLNEKDRCTIEEMENVIDDLGKEMKLKDERLINFNEKSLDFQNVIERLGVECNIKNEELKSLTNQITLANENKESLKLANENEEPLKLTNENKEELNRIQNENQTLTTKLTELENIKLKFGDLQKDSSRTIETLEAEIEDWVRKSEQQSDNVNKLNDDLAFFQNQLNTSKSDLKEEEAIVSKESKIFKFDIENKNVQIKTLQHELNEKHDQYEKVLSALNKRRIESKTFLNIQSKIQNELERKEDVIRKLKFKLKSSDGDTSLDLNDDSFGDVHFDVVKSDDDWSELDNDVIDERKGLELMTQQLSNTRERNNVLRDELEKCREKYITLEHEKCKAEQNVNILTTNFNEVKGKLDELRGLMHKSPNESFSDETKTIAFKTKLYAAYKELREKTIEIATLRLNLEMKDVEIETLNNEIEKMNREISDVARSSVPVTIVKCTHSNNIKTLVNELNNRDQNEGHLQDQITELRLKLMTKSEHSDYLQNELTNVVGKLKNVERKLLEEDWSLRERFVYGSEENSEISEFTPVTANSGLSMFKDISGDKAANDTFSISNNMLPTDSTVNKTANETANDIFLIDGFNESKGIKDDEKLEFENSIFQKQEEILYCKEQINQLRNEITYLNEEKKKKELFFKKENETIKNQLLETKNILLEKEKEITTLQSQLTGLTEQNADTVKENRQTLQDFNILKEQLEMTKKRYEIELDNLKSTSSNLKSEHVSSLKNKLEETSKEKLALQVKLKELQVKLIKRDETISTLKVGLQNVVRGTTNVYSHDPKSI